MRTRVAGGGVPLRIDVLNIYAIAHLEGRARTDERDAGAAAGRDCDSPGLAHRADHAAGWGGGGAGGRGRQHRAPSVDPDRLGRWRHGAAVLGLGLILIAGPEPGRVVDEDE